MKKTRMIETPGQLTRWEEIDEPGTPTVSVESVRRLGFEMFRARVIDADKTTILFETTRWSEMIARQGADRWVANYMGKSGEST